MTLGEKIKETRKHCGLSQEQLSEKIGVSRSAVAKWETDKGLPDIDNLKVLAMTLDVSVDYLLDNGEEIDKMVIREAYNLSNYGKGRRKQKKDRLIKERFSGYEIHTLLPKYIQTKRESVIDNILGFVFDAPFGIPSFIAECKNMDKEYYLVEKDNEQLFVMVTDEFIERRKLAKRVNDDKFQIGDFLFIKCKYEVK